MSVVAAGSGKPMLQVLWHAAFGGTGVSRCIRWGGCGQRCGAAVDRTAEGGMMEAG